MKKYFIVSLVFISSCQKNITDQTGTINIKGEIVYVSTRIINNYPIPQIFGMNADGTNQRLIFDKPAGPPVLSHSKKKIAFTTNENSYACLYTIDIDGQNLKFLTKTKYSCFSPAWSPDDSKITFVISDTTPPYDNNIYTINADGTNKIQLTNHDENHTPIYFPDNSAIIYTSTNGIICGVYKMNIDGTNKQLLSPPGKSFNVSSISPNGKMIAINSDDRNGTQIFVMNTDGSNLKQLTFTVEKNYYDTGFPRGGNYNPIWSPDNSRIVYVSAENTAPDIFIINPDGSGNKRLTDSPKRDECPAWSDDGRYIIYAAKKVWYSGSTPTYGAWVISIMTTNGQLKTELTDNIGGDLYPIFIPK
jgi:Tol biopolymer transport system component